MTEFFPVSSSGHLSLGEYFLGIEPNAHQSLFHLACHLGTLGALVYLLLPSLRIHNLSHQLKPVLLGTLPLVPLAPVVTPLKEAVASLDTLGPSFLVTAALLLAGERGALRLTTRRLSPHLRDPLIIGLFQTLALFPGISRSGATISAACLLGWPKARAIHYSFLLAIPTIVGGTAWEGWHAWRDPTSLVDMPLSVFGVGFLTSLVTGCLALRLLTRVVLRGRLNYFGWYCLALGILITLYFHGTQTI